MDRQKENDEFISILTSFLEKGDLDGFKTSFKNSSMDLEQEDSQSIFIKTAIKKEHSDIILFLINNGFSVNKKDFTGESILDFVSENEKESSLLLFLKFVKEYGEEKSFTYNNLLSILKNHQIKNPHLFISEYKSMNTKSDYKISEILTFVISQNNKPLVEWILETHEFSSEKIIALLKVPVSAYIKSFLIDFISRRKIGKNITLINKNIQLIDGLKKK